MVTRPIKNEKEVTVVQGRDYPASGLLGRGQGYRIGTIQRFERGEKSVSSEVWIELLPRQRRRMRCSGCGRSVSKVHDFVERWIRDLPIMDARTWLLVWRRRV